MSILSAVQAGIAIADKITKPLQGQISIQPWIGQDGVGGHSYGTTKLVNAAIDTTRKRVFGQGQEVVIMASLTIMEAIADTVATPPHVRVNPIDPRDIITLPDGTTGPTILAGGYMDPSTSRPVSNDVMLGATK